MNAIAIVIADVLLDAGPLADRQGHFRQVMRSPRVTSAITCEVKKNRQTGVLSSGKLGDTLRRLAAL